jgi:hypothetical protein
LFGVKREIAAIKLVFELPSPGVGINLFVEAPGDWRMAQAPYLDLPIAIPFSEGSHGYPLSL